MKTSLLLPVALGAVMAGCGGIFSSDDTPSLDVDRMMADVVAMSHDSLFGRQAGSVHELAVAELLRDRFVGIGLEAPPAGYTQSFPVAGGKFVVTDQCAQSPAHDQTQRTSQNVVGILPGKGQLADEYVLVTAHYDHLGCQVISADSIWVFNGADDNASGTAAILEIARVLESELASSDLSHRSIMFAAFGAEEPGLIGSAYFVANPPVEIEKMAAAVNLDMVGRLRANSLTLVGTSAAEGWESLLNSKNDAGLTLNYDDTFIARGDHFYLIAAGVPAIHFFTGTHPQYHQPGDDADLLDVDGFLTVGNMALATVRSLAFSSTLPRIR